jgi:hypothetical protein
MDSTTKVEYMATLEVDNIILDKGTKVSPKDQIYTQLSHLRMSDA